MQKTKWYFVVNPNAGGGKARKRWESIQVLLQKTGIQYEFGISEYAGQSIELANAAVLNGFKHIAAVGGDGTANEVINGIFEQDKVPTQDITFAMIPLGTGNDWIKTHKIPNNYKKAILLLNEGHTHFHDIGKVLYFNENQEQKHRYFINVAGLAYDAFVTKASKDRSRWTSYFYLILKGIRQFHPSPAKVIFDGQEMEHHFYNITVGIAKYNGGGTLLVPQAKTDDGLFALTLVKDISPWEMVLKAHKFYNGSIIHHPQAFATQAKSIRVEAPAETPAIVEVDGELLGQTPIEFVMFEKAIQVVTP